MKTQELLELAALDALGLLDEAERDAFDLAFRAAPPALQAQIRREQTRIAGDDSLLPRVETPLGLKARVLAAWREAVDSVSLKRGDRRLFPSMAPSRGVSPLWRAGAIGCAAAAIVLAVTMFTIKAQLREYDAATYADSLAQYWQKEFGNVFQRNLFNSETKFVQFVPDSKDCSTKAILMLDPSSGKGQFLCKELPSSAATYQLVALDKDGNPILNAQGEPVKVYCEIHVSSDKPGLLFNQKVTLSEESPNLGIVAAYAGSEKPTLLMKARNL